MAKRKQEPKAGRPSLSGDGETEGVIKMRVTAEDRKLFTEAAGGRGKVSKWARDTLRRVANRILRDQP